MTKRLTGGIVSIRSQPDYDPFPLLEEDPDIELPDFLPDSAPWGDGPLCKEIYIAESCGLDLKEYLPLRRLAYLLPGENTWDPRDKIWQYLIEEYSFGLETMRDMTAREMSLYIAARLQPLTGTRTGEAKVPADRITSTSTDRGSPRLRTFRRPAKTEARDAWLYQEACKEDPPTWRSLMIHLNRVAEDQGWTKLGSVQGVKQAVGRYAVAQNLPAPAPRKQS
jgi:hypothetical protein